MLLGVAPNTSDRISTPLPVSSCLMSACASTDFCCGSSPADTDSDLRLCGTSPSTCLTQSRKLSPKLLCVTNRIPTTDHPLILLKITYLKTESPHLVGRATPDAAGKARPTVNHLTVMSYVKLNNSLDSRLSEGQFILSLSKGRNDGVSAPCRAHQ